LCQPLRLPCQHSFCRACISSAFQSEKRCPLCRAAAPPDFNPDAVVVDRALENVLRRKCTVEYHQRLRETAAITARTIQLRIGNRHEITGNWKVPHKWTAFVEMEENYNGQGVQFDFADLIEKVRFTLVPACNVLWSADFGDASANKKEPEVHQPPFEVTGTSWGLFTVHIQVFWKSWLSLPVLYLSHELAAGECTHWNYGVDLGAAAQLVAEGLPSDSLDELMEDMTNRTAEIEDDQPVARIAHEAKPISASRYFSDITISDRDQLSQKIEYKSQQKSRTLSCSWARASKAFRASFFASK